MGISGGFAALGGMSLVNSYNSANSQKAMADFTAAQFDTNRKIALAQGASAKAAGDIEAGQMAEQTKMNVAKQRVSAAATGADVNSGSAMELQTDTNWQGKQNQVMIRNNAWMKAWGYTVQADNYESQGEFASLSGSNAFTNTLLTGGMQATGYGLQSAQAYYKYSKDK